MSAFGGERRPAPSSPAAGCLGPAVGVGHPAGVSHALDAHVQRAARQAQVQRLSGLLRGRVAHDGAVLRRADDGVAALQRRERAERLQRGAAARQVRASARQPALEHQRQAVVEPGQSTTIDLQASVDRPRCPIEQQADALALGGEVGGRAEAVQRPPLGLQSSRGAGRPGTLDAAVQPSAQGPQRVPVPHATGRPAPRPQTGWRRARRPRTRPASRPSRGRHQRRSGTGAPPRRAPRSPR